jgi:hypothetical protein
LCGDVLKKSILDALAEKLNNCERSALPDLIASIRCSPEYSILKTRQNPWILGWFFKPQTDSIQQLEKMINAVERAEHLELTRPSR